MHNQSFSQTCWVSVYYLSSGNVVYGSWIFLCTHRWVSKSPEEDVCVQSDCPCSFSHRSVTTVSRIVAMALPYYMTLTLEGARRQTTGGSSSFVTVMKTSECVRRERERERQKEGRKEGRKGASPSSSQRPWRAQAGVWCWGRERGREEGSD